jgi:hypothetical protein
VSGPSGQGGSDVTGPTSGQGGGDVGSGPSGQGGGDVTGPTSGQGGFGPGPSGQGGFGPSGPSGQGGFGPSGPSGQGGFGTGASGPSGQGGADVVGPGPSGAGGASQVCDSFGDDCTTCIASECSDLWCECSFDDDCLPFLQCSGNCETQECVSDCQEDFAPGVSLAYLVIDCAERRCEDECPGAAEIPPCTECLLEDCDDEMNACFGEPDCWSLYECLIECAPIDLECNDACYDTYPNGIGPLQDVLECAEDECDQVCT